MKTQTSKLLLIIGLLISTTAMSQEVSPSREGMWPSFIRYDSNRPLFNKVLIQMTDQNKERYNLTEVALMHKEIDESGVNHYRYQQNHNNIPVEHAVWVVHEVDGKISSQNGKMIKLR